MTTTITPADVHRALEIILAEHDYANLANPGEASRPVEIVVDRNQGTHLEVSLWNGDDIPSDQLGSFIVTAVPR